MAKHEQVLIFDADGVLIKPWGFATALETEFGISRDQTGEFFRGPFHSCLLGQTSLVEVLPDYLTAWGWPHSGDAFVQLWLESENLPNAELLDLIAQLHCAGYRCCVASNQEPVRARFMKQQMGFANLFDAVFFSCDLQAMKPDRKFYLAIENSLSARPEDIWFWDDSATHVSAATAAGWNANLFTDLMSVTQVIATIEHD